LLSLLSAVCHSFIQGFSQHACPLFDLTKNNTLFIWSQEAQATFEMLKAAITSVPILALPQDNLPYHLEADSSDFATGMVLSQQSKDNGKWHPVAFYSKSLSPVECNYEIHDKQMLAIVCTLEEWCHFLEGATHPVEIFTDHKNIKYFMSAKKLNCCPACGPSSWHASTLSFTTSQAVQWASQMHSPGTCKGDLRALVCSSDLAKGGSKDYK